MSSLGRWSLLPLVLLLSLGGPAGACPADLNELVKKYEEVKAAWLKAKRQPARRGGPGRGPGGPGGPGRGRGQGGREEPEPLFPAILAVAEVGTRASLSYVAREYADDEPEVSVAAGKALVAVGSKTALKYVTAGYNRRRTWTASTKAAILDALAQSKNKDGLEFVVKLATRGKGDDRLIAMGSLALLPESAEAAAALVDSLDDRQPEIRRAALRALATFRLKSLIGPLIERVDKEKDEALQVEALELLVSLTGVNMGLVAQDWAKWWDGAEKDFKVGEKKSGEKTAVVASDLKYFGIEVSSKRIAFLVDASVSMDAAPGARGFGGGPGRGGRGRGGGGGGGAPGGGGGAPGGGGGAPGAKTKLEIMKDEMVRLLSELPAETAMNMLFFHASVVPWKPRLQQLSGRVRDEAIQFVKDLKTGFGTNIYDTLERALEDEQVDTIYLLSDGRPYGGKFEAPEDILREINAINRVRGVTIHCIAFGEESDFLEDLAKQNGGIYRFTNGTDNKDDAEKPEASDEPEDSGEDS